MLLTIIFDLKCYNYFMATQKLYCYVDETGQDTKGKLFLVAIVLKEIEQLESLEKKLEEIEKRSSKKQIKWKRLKKDIKIKYLKELLQIRELRKSIFYSVYENTTEYTSLTSFTVAKAVLSKSNADYTVTVIIDELNDRERDTVRKELKKLKVKYNKIRGMKDEQNIFLRLSDAMAGFLREVYEKEEYALTLIKKFESEQIVVET